MKYKGKLIDKEGNIYYPELYDSGWIEPKLSNGVVTPALASKGKVRYRKYGNLVQIIGSVKGITQSTAVFTLQEGFRPITRIDNIVAQSGTRWLRMFVSPSGAVYAETSSDDYNKDRWIALDCMFLVG